MSGSVSLPLRLQKLEVQKRTEGDGMENTDVSEIKESHNNESLQNSNKSNLIDRLIYRPKESAEIPVSPPVITGQIVHLLPKTPIRKEGNLIGILSAKEPKFIPYEPYKAAVKPIVPRGKHKRKKTIKITDVHLKPEGKVDLKDNNETRSCDSPNSAIEISNTIKIGFKEDIDKIPCDVDAERKVLDEELKRLREENGQLESQLKFQAQVNGELKNLLVAAMGEDLETRVHLLTEDKLQLARALLTSAKKLSTHQEQTEYLAGQCEVWRSKFLASSLMVEDLAKWKAALCQKASELQETMKSILEERLKVRESLISAYTELNFLYDKFDVTALKGGDRQSGPKSCNIVDLASAVQRLSLHLRLQLLGDVGELNSILCLKDLGNSTCAEQQAEQLLLHPLALIGQPDVACNAVLGAAVACGVGHMHSTLAPACCSHCSGEIKLV